MNKYICVTFEMIFVFTVVLGEMSLLGDEIDILITNDVFYFI